VWCILASAVFPLSSAAYHSTFPLSESHSLMCLSHFLWTEDYRHWCLENARAHQSCLWSRFLKLHIITAPGQTSPNFWLGHCEEQHLNLLTCLRACQESESERCSSISTWSCLITTFHDFNELITVGWLHKRHSSHRPERFWMDITATTSIANRIKHTVCTDKGYTWIFMLIFKPFTDKEI